MPPAKGGASVWDNAEFLNDVVIGLYEAGTATKPGFSPQLKTAVQEYLAAQGHQVSWEAIRQHVQKLRKNRDTSAFKSASGASTPAGTPAKPKAPGSGKKTPAKNGEKTPRKRFAEDTYDDEDFKHPDIKSEGDFEDIESPTKNLPSKRFKKSPSLHDDEV